MAIIPEKYLDLLQRKKAFANLATLMPDGSPQVTPVWCDYKDGLVRVNKYREGTSESAQRTAHHRFAVAAQVFLVHRVFNRLSGFRFHGDFRSQ